MWNLKNKMNEYNETDSQIQKVSQQLPVGKGRMGGARQGQRIKLNKGVQNKLKDIFQHREYGQQFIISLYKAAQCCIPETCVSDSKDLPTMQETWVLSLDWEDPLRREWQPTTVFLPGEVHRQTSLAGHSPWGCMELGTTNTINQLYFIKTNYKYSTLTAKYG